MVNVIFNGRLGADAEIRQNKIGSQYVTFNVAVNEFRDKEEKTSWLRVFSHEDRHIKLAQHLKKGSFVSINGKEYVGTFVDKNGNTQISREVTAFNISFVNSSKSENNDASKSTTNQTTVPTPSPTVNNVQMEMSCGTLQPQIANVGASATVAEDDLPF